MISATSCTWKTARSTEMPLTSLKLWSWRTARQISICRTHSISSRFPRDFWTSPGNKEPMVWAQHSTPGKHLVKSIQGSSTKIWLTPRPACQIFLTARWWGARNLTTQRWWRLSMWTQRIIRSICFTTKATRILANHELGWPQINKPHWPTTSWSTWYLAMQGVCRPSRRLKIGTETWGTPSRTDLREKTILILITIVRLIRWGTRLRCTRASTCTCLKSATASNERSKCRALRRKLMNRRSSLSSRTLATSNNVCNILCLTRKIRSLRTCPKK